MGGSGGGGSGGGGEDERRGTRLPPPASASVYRRRDALLLLLLPVSGLAGAAMFGRRAEPALADSSSAASAAAAAPSGLARQMEPYADVNKGFRILRPSGWNEFEGSPDNFDIKWQDVVQPLEFVTVLTAPVQRGKSMTDLGSAEAVGRSLANKRNAQLLAADQKQDADGIVYYVLEYKRESAHQLTLLTINKNKLYSVNVSASERRWSRREKLLRAVVDSFVPRL